MAQNARNAKHRTRLYLTYDEVAAITPDEDGRLWLGPDPECSGIGLENRLSP